MNISDVCEELGLSARTVRYYEELSLLPGVRRKENGRRVYGDDQVERLRFIQRLKALGLSLSEIRELNAVYAIAGSTRQMLGHLAELLDDRLGELDSRIEELTALRTSINDYRGKVGERIGASQ